MSNQVTVDFISMFYLWNKHVNKAEQRLSGQIQYVGIDDVE